jgi:hypothetical protein
MWACFCLLKANLQLSKCDIRIFQFWFWSQIWELRKSNFEVNNKICDGNETKIVHQWNWTKLDIFVYFLRMRLCYPPVGITSPKSKLLCFITTKFFCEEKNVLAFNRDRCCHLVLCLQLIPFHCLNDCRKLYKFVTLNTLFRTLSTTAKMYLHFNLSKMGDGWDKDWKYGLFSRNCLMASFHSQMFTQKAKICG